MRTRYIILFFTLLGDLMVHYMFVDSLLPSVTLSHPITFYYILLHLLDSVTFENSRLHSDIVLDTIIYTYIYIYILHHLKLYCLPVNYIALHGDKLHCNIHKHSIV